MDRTSARRFANLALIIVMIVVVIVGVSLQFDSIESRAQQPRQDTTAVAAGQEAVRTAPPSTTDRTRRDQLTPGGDLPSRLWKVAFYVALIVAAILLGARILRRFGGERLKQTSSPDIRILGRRYISPKQSLAIVKVRHKELLLGITDHSIELLYDFTPEE